MTERYGLRVNFVNSESDHALLAGRCLKVLHGFQCQRGQSSIGVTFPDWGDSGPGASIGFVSLERSDLEALRQQPYFQNMLDMALFDIQTISVVPEEAMSVKFRRNSSVDKHRAGGRQRQIRRGLRVAERQGREYVPQNSTVTYRETPLHHSLPISSSKRPEVTYFLRVQKELSVGKTNDLYTSYGLSNKEGCSGAVPAFL